MVLLQLSSIYDRAVGVTNLGVMLLCELPTVVSNNRTLIYLQTSNTSHTLEDNKIFEHSDIVGASPVGAAPTTSSFSTKHLASMDWAKTTARQDLEDEKHLSVGIWCDLY